MRYKIPQRLSIEFTNHCNHKCVMCPQTVFTRQKGYLSDEVFDVFLENAHKYARVVTVGFFGEQMLHPDFCEYVDRLAHKRSYKMVLFSNWSLLGGGMIPSVMKFDTVKISLDASNAELFNRLCPSGDYKKIVDNIERWLSIPSHPKTYLVFVTSSLNKKYKGAFLRKWLPKLSKNDSIITKSVISYGGVMSDEYMYPCKCNVLSKPRLTVSWNGDVSPCNLDVNMSMKAGNILESSLDEIVNSNSYKRQLRAIRDKRSICSKCFDANNHQETVIHHGRANA